MCLSRCGQILYGVAIFVALGLTIGGMFSPGWRQFETRVRDVNSHNVKHTVNMGLFAFACTSSTENTDNHDSESTRSGIEYCKAWWEHRPDWEKAVVVLVGASVLFELVALVYNFITFCCCCCRGHALKPLAPLATLALIALGIALAIYGIKNRHEIGTINNWNHLGDPKNTVSYSFYLCVTALPALLVAIVVGSMSAFLGDKCL